MCSSMMGTLTLICSSQGNDKRLSFTQRMYDCFYKSIKSTQKNTFFFVEMEQTANFLFHVRVCFVLGHA